MTRNDPQGPPYDQEPPEDPYDDGVSALVDHDAELALLAAALSSPSARREARNVVVSGDFYLPERSLVWDTMADLDREKIPVDPIVVQTRLSTNRRAVELLVGLVGRFMVPDHAAQYAATVRGWSTRRKVVALAAQVRHEARNPAIDASGMPGQIASRFAAIRDGGVDDDIQSITLGELLAEPDDEPDWVIPGLLEHRDRFMLTGGEGLGKSFLLRQIAVFAAAGLDPFTLAHIEPKTVLIVDCENSTGQIKRKARGVVQHAKSMGRGDPEFVHLLCVGRIDITRDKDLSAIHREMDVIQPDIVVIGPIYKMSPKALMTDDDAAPVLAALDSLRENGAALLMEAHAGHAQGSDGRNFRPRGSAALLGWPEFGYGLKPIASGYADLVPWRGDRDVRAWPTSLKHDHLGVRWIEHDGRGYATTPTRGNL